MLYLSKLVNVVGKYSLFFLLISRKLKGGCSIRRQVVLPYVKLWVRSKACAWSGCPPDKAPLALIFHGVLRFLLL